MSYSLLIDPGARLDIVESINWYNGQKPGLGRRYYNSVRLTMKQIKSNPFMFQQRYKNLRIVPVEKFPFIVLYLVDEEKKLVAVTAVLHTSRAPKIWDQRTFI